MVNLKLLKYRQTRSLVKISVKQFNVITAYKRLHAVLSSHRLIERSINSFAIVDIDSNQCAPRHYKSDDRHRSSRTQFVDVIVTYIFR